MPDWAKKRIPGSDSVWAPDIQFHNGRFWLYYSISTMGSQRSAIGLVMNRTLNPSSPDYRWEDQGPVLESFPDRQDFNAIDPALFVDADGSAWLFWGSYWTGIKAAEVNPETGKLKHDLSAVPPIAIARRADKGPPAIEGAYVVKRNSFYYLFVSWDFCCAREQSSYKIMVGRSRSPQGPYVDDQGVPLSEGGGRLLLMSTDRWRGPGHNSLLHTGDRTWLVYHVVDATAPEKGRQLQHRALDWKNGWPIARPPEELQKEPETRSPLVGRWRHTVNNQDQYDIFFEPTGEITGTAGPAFWQRAGRRLTMKWKDPRAPGGYWIDVVTVGASSDAYEGRNQNGTTIAGRKVAGAVLHRNSATPSNR